MCRGCEAAKGAWLLFTRDLYINCNSWGRAETAKHITKMEFTSINKRSHV